MTIRSICFALASIAFASSAYSAPELPSQASDRAKQVIEHWTPARIASARPRDFTIDSRSRAVSLKGKPGGSDTTPPDIIETSISPSDGSIIGSEATFSAQIVDAESGLKSVIFSVINEAGFSQSFSPTLLQDDTWAVTLVGFTSGNWSWQIEAKDNGGKGGNTATGPIVNFTVDTVSGGSPGDTGSTGYITTNARYTDGGDVQEAAGRIYFEMPADRRARRWNGYVCSGTVATDGSGLRSVIMTAAHCVYDDQYKKFARNVLFIPNQGDTSGSRTDGDCTNDPLGCWVPSFGVVDQNWASNRWPDNIEWDYAYYVVSDENSHEGPTGINPALDVEVQPLSINFGEPKFDDSDPSAASPDFTHALGYSYSDDPFFMYCAEDMTTVGNNNWWLPTCGLSGGASGGPWIQPLIDGSGEIISVNSWGYSSSPGMAGPKLNGTSASCLFDDAKSTSFEAIPATGGEEGITSSCVVSN